jgi:hypothetical protein
MSMDYENGEYIDADTRSGRDCPSLRQFLVILENRVGSLTDLVLRLERDDLRVIALSIVDNVDVSIARVLLDNVERGRELFELSGFTFFENDMVGVELPEDARPFVSICSSLLQAEVNVNYMYPLLYRRSGRSAIAINVDDIDMAISVLTDQGLKIVTERDLKDDDEHFG